MATITSSISNAEDIRREPNGRADNGVTALAGRPIQNGGTEQSVGAAMHDLVAQLYPTCRSITGDGVRATLRQLQEIVPLEIHEVPSGTRVFDWTVPKEWNIRDAYIKDAAGRRVVDFRASNLHVVSYSAGVRAEMMLDELRPHLHTLPDHPDWIPYRTSYYQETWGFCLTHRQLLALRDERYEVCIDSTLTDGHLTYGEVYLPGETTDEVLISCHVCHPSLCNDNLSGVAVAAYLAQHVTTQSRRRYSYRFIFVPGTIGAITWLALHEQQLDRIQHGIVLTLVGDGGSSTYKKSRRGNAPIDRAFEHVLRHSGAPFTIQEFDPLGYDERQYCSPGINLPVGCLMRTPPGQYPEYHTSADDLQFVRPDALQDSWAKCVAVLQVLEGDRRYQNLSPKGEPQLGRRGLYRAIGGQPEQAQIERALLWVLNFSDGEHSLLEISERSQLPFSIVRRAADLLAEHGLLAEIAETSTSNSALDHRGEVTQ